MAYATGTASSHTDLWTKLLSFLTTNSSLVSAGQAWTQVWSVTNQVVLKGPGLAGADNIYIGLSRVDDPANDSYSIHMRGMSGILAGATDIGGHINVSKVVGIYSDSQPMTYWFVANGRRFVVVLKISTVFQAMYGGLFLPYAVPDSYPYPLFVGGTRGENPSTPVSWRNTNADHTQFISPNYSAPTIRDSCAFMLSPAAEWLRCWNNGSDPGEPKIGIAPEQMFEGWGIEDNGSNGYGYDSIRQKMTAAYDGTFPLIDIALVQALPSDQTYGVLHGCYRVPGAANSSENIITSGSVNHLVVQNAFRTGTGQYWALALE